MNKYIKKFFNIIRPLGGPLIFIFIHTLNLDLEAKQINMLAIFLMTIYFWVDGKIPLFVSGILAVSLAIFYNIDSANNIFSSFSSSIIFLFLAGFLYAFAMKKTGLDKRVSLYILSQNFIGKSFNKLLLTLYSLTAFLSMWVSNTATAAMMLPIILGVLDSVGIKDKVQKSYILLGMAFSASVGGLGTPIGSPPNIIAIGLLQELLSIEISFYQWFSYALPLVIIFTYIIYALTIKRVSYSGEIDKSFLETELKKLGAFSSKERVLTIFFLLLVSFWFLPDLIYTFHKTDTTLYLKENFSASAVGLFFSSLLFIFPLRSESKILDQHHFKEIDWGTLFLFGAGISLGKLLFSTGLATLAGDWLISSISSINIFYLLSFLIIFTMLLTTLVSNTASANILIPIIIASGASLGIHPLLPVIASALACSLSFMLPIATPPNAIVYGSGEVNSLDMLKFGFVVSLVFAIILIIVFSIIGNIL